MEDVCIVCAEPLEWVAYAPCGHKVACDKCVCRLRSVMKDSRCVLCQVPSEAVFVTRWVGDYTPTLAAGDWDELKRKARAKDGVWAVPAAGTFFDDESEARAIKARCSFSHPSLARRAEAAEVEEEGGEGETDGEGAGGTSAAPRDGPASAAAAAPHSGSLRTFPTLAALKAALAKDRGLHLCPVCLEGRKVFVSEQEAYTRRDLAEHARSGNVPGPLRDAGFRGHPECRFCRLRFYGDGELYAHMSSVHEQCFLCRRADPASQEYFRDYEGLEAHFRDRHYACSHPTCLEKKFVVFSTQPDLRAHVAREHPEVLSKHERRQALTLPAGATSYREQDGGGAGRGGARGLDRAGGGGRGRRGAGPSNEAAPDALAPPPPAPRQGVIMGGGSGAATQRGAAVAAAAARAAENVARLAAARDAEALARIADLAAAARGGAATAPDRPAAEAFPAVGEGSAQGQSTRAAGSWAGGRSHPGVLGLSGSNDDLFPALPSAAKAERRKANRAARTLAGELTGTTSAGWHGAPPPPRGRARVLVPGQAPGDASAGVGRARAGAPTPAHSAAAAGPSASAAPSPPPAAGLAPVRRRDEVAAEALNSRGDRGGGLFASGEPGAPAATAADRALAARVRSRLGPDGFASFTALVGRWVRGEAGAGEFLASASEAGLEDLVPDIAAACPDRARSREVLEAAASGLRRRARETASAGGAALASGAGLGVLEAGVPDDDLEEDDEEEDSDREGPRRAVRGGAGGSGRATPAVGARGPAAARTAQAGDAPSPSGGWVPPEVLVAAARRRAATSGGAWATPGPGAGAVSADAPAPESFPSLGGGARPTAAARPASAARPAGPPPRPASAPAPPRAPAPEAFPGLPAPAGVQRKPLGAKKPAPRLTSRTPAPMPEALAALALRPVERAGDRPLALGKTAKGTSSLSPGKAAKGSGSSAPGPSSEPTQPAKAKKVNVSLREFVTGQAAKPRKAPAAGQAPVAPRGQWADAGALLLEERAVQDAWGRK